MSSFPQVANDLQAALAQEEWVSLEQDHNHTSLFDSSYRLLSVIGRGRYSIVYSARRITARSANDGGLDPSGRDLAIKILTRSRATMAQQLGKEGLAMLLCEGAGVVRLFDYVSSGESSYLTMELMEGGSLANLLATRTRPIRADRALQVILQVLDGVEQIHRAGVIHRDIKPDNLLVSRSGEIKIADFGACFLPTDGLGDSNFARGIGTLDYLAPECITGSGICEATDIYSLAVTLFQLLTLRLPVKGNSIGAIVDRKLSGQTLPLAQFLDNAPGALVHLCEKSLATDPRDRFQSVSQFRRALLRVLAMKKTEFVSPKSNLFFPEPSAT